jgi:hypothetical protein
MVRYNSWSNSHTVPQSLRVTKKMSMIAGISTHSKCRIHIGKTSHQPHSSHSSQSMLATNSTTHRHHHTPLFSALSTENQKRWNSRSPNSIDLLLTHRSMSSTRDEMSANSKEVSPSTTLPIPHSSPTLGDGSRTDLNTTALN